LIGRKQEADPEGHGQTALYSHDADDRSIESIVWLYYG